MPPVDPIVGITTDNVTTDRFTLHFTTIPRAERYRLYHGVGADITTIDYPHNMFCVRPAETCIFVTGVSVGVGLDTFALSVVRDGHEGTPTAFVP